MVFQLLTPLGGAVTHFHSHGPDAAGHPTDHGVFRVHAVGKEKGEVRGDVIDVHAPGQVVLDVGKTVGERQGQLGDGVGAGLGDMVARH